MKVYLDGEPVPIWSTATPIAGLQGRGATNTLAELTMDGSVLLPGHHFLWVHTRCKSLPRNSPATPDEAKNGLQAGAALGMDAMSTDTAFFVVQPPRLSFSFLSHDSVTLHAYGAGPATFEACVWAFRPHTSAGGGCIPPRGGVRCTVLDSSVVQPRVVVRPRLGSCVSPSSMVVITIACECWLHVLWQDGVHAPREYSIKVQSFNLFWVLALHHDVTVLTCADGPACCPGPRRLQYHGVAARWPPQQGRWRPSACVCVVWPRRPCC